MYNKPALWKINLSLGDYREVDVAQISAVYYDIAVPDPEGLLGMVMKPSTITGVYHGKLLQLLANEGLDNPVEAVAVGPALDGSGKAVAGKIRVVEYASRS